jgi:hypothetical protein
MLHEMLHADAQLADNVRVRLCLKIGRSTLSRSAARSVGNPPAPVFIVQRVLEGKVGEIQCTSCTRRWS